MLRGQQSICQIYPKHLTNKTSTAVQSLLTSLLSEKPVICFVDFLQWANAISMETFPQLNCLDKIAISFIVIWKKGGYIKYTNKNIQTISCYQFISIATISLFHKHWCKAFISKPRSLHDKLLHYLNSLHKINEDQSFNLNIYK